MIDPPKKFFRLGPGREVRLKYAYIIYCEDYKLDDSGNVVEIHCTYDSDTKSGSGISRKVKGTLGWVNASTSINVEVRQYDRLFDVEDLSSVDNFLEHLNPHSLDVIPNAKVEPSVQSVGAEEHIQFERIGYFIKDKENSEENMVLNRTVSLRDNWSRK